MTLLSMALAHRSPLLSRLQTLALQLQRFGHSFARDDGGARECRDVASEDTSRRGSFDKSTRKIVDSRAAGIKRSAISSEALAVLKILQKNGFEAYLVGGCVRDLLLKKTPKDFDVITTANLKQIKKQFNRCIIVGRQFPICLVSLLNSVVEVSSFSTTHKNVTGEQKTLPAQMPSCNVTTDYVRWNNSVERDFTINGLFYDPFVNTIYDYVNGIRDLRTSTVRTVIPAHLSFKKDCARILRGLRIAARLGLQFSMDTDAAIRDLYSSVATLSEQRLMMEVNFMLAYGAAERSLCLLQKYKLLEILLPVHAGYLADQKRKGSDECSTMLLKLFSNADKLLSADRPSNCNLWLALLAFHMALLYHPQDALVVWTLCSILYHGTVRKAVKFSRERSEVHVQFFPEILVPSTTKSDESLLEETSHFAKLIQISLSILTDANVHKHLLAGRQNPSPCLGLVFVPRKTGRSVHTLFDILATDIKSYAKERKTCEIDYKLLKNGDLDETRFVFGKIIMDTMERGEGAFTLEHHPNMAAEKKNLHELTCKENKTSILVQKIPHNPNIAAVEESCLDELTRKQSLKGSTTEESHLHEITNEHSPEVAATNMRQKHNCEHNHNVATGTEIYKHFSERKNKMVAAKKTCKHTGERDQKVSVANKSCEPNQNMAEPKESHLFEITREQCQNMTSLKKNSSDELTHQNNQKAAPVGKRRPLSALFKRRLHPGKCIIIGFRGPHVYHVATYNNLSKVVSGKKYNSEGRRRLHPGKYIIIGFRGPYVYHVATNNSLSKVVSGNKHNSE